MEGNRWHVVVVGGGIAGLAAAWYLRQGGERVRVTVVDGAERIGGKLHATEVAGVSMDAGAEAMLARRPEGKDLARMVGLGEELRLPGTTQAGILTRGTMRSMPKGHVMGVPSDVTMLAKSGILSLGGLARVPLDQILPETRVTADVSVAAYIRARMGARGGRAADRAAARRCLRGHGPSGCRWTRRCRGSPSRPDPERSLLNAAREIAAEAPKDAGPVFTTLRRGMGSLPEAVAAASGAEIRTGVMVREMRRTEGGWRLVAGPVPEPEIIEADAVIVAAPGPAASRLLAAEVPQASAELARIEYASMAIVTLAYPREAFPEPPTGSGYLVPPVDGRAIKAATFSSVKWPHLAETDPNLILLRCSIGRIGEEAVLQRDDAELVAAGDGRDGRGHGRARAAPRLPGDPLGRLPAAVRRGPPRPDRPHPRGCRRPARVWPSAGPPTMASAFPPASPPPARAAARILDHLDPAGEWHREADSLTKG